MNKVIDICAKKREKQELEWKASLNESIRLLGIGLAALDYRLKRIERGDENA